MELSHYYALYDRFRTGNAVRVGVAVARMLHLRHLLVRMDVNFLCNLRCRTCYFSAPDSKKFFRPSMTLDQFKAIADDVFPKTRILYLSCGAEPLMTKNFDEFLRATAPYRVPHVGYITNGLLLTEDVIVASMESRVSEITVSIDGATKATYDYIRQRGDFDVLLSKLSLFGEVATRTGGYRPALRFNYTVTRSNHSEMPLLIDLARQFGASVVKFRIYQDWGGQLSYEEESLAGYERSFNESLNEAEVRAQKAGIRVYAPKKFELDARGMPVIKESAVETISKPPCTYPWFFRYINPEGRTRVCAFLPLSDVQLGNGSSLEAFRSIPEEVQRKKLLCRGSEHSCFNTVCHGALLKRANDDVNYLVK